MEHDRAITARDLYALRFVGDPQASPDGAQVAFGSSRNRSFDIYLMNPDGSGVNQLTSGLGRQIEPGFQGFAVSTGGGGWSSSEGPTSGAAADNGTMPVSGNQDHTDRETARAYGLKLRVAKRQHVVRRGGVTLYATCNLACPLAVTGKLAIIGTRRTVSLRGVRRRLAAHQTTRLKLKLTPSRARSVAQLLARGRRLQARIAVRVGDDPTARPTKLRVRTLR